MNEIIAMVGGLVMIGYFFATLVIAHLDGVEFENTSEFD
jgi:hypothetical protein